MDAVSKGTLALCKPECIRCTHLVSFAEEHVDDAEEFTCTAENGNDMCPAQAVLLVIGANVEKASTAIANAFIGGNAEDVAAKMRKLGGYHSTVQASIMAEVRRKLASSVQAPVIIPTVLVAEPEVDAKPTLATAAEPAAAVGDAQPSAEVKGEAKPADERAPKQEPAPAKPAVAKTGPKPVPAKPTKA